MSVFAVGNKMEFTDEPGSIYEIRAASDRFAVMTRPATQEDMDAFEIEGSPEGKVVYSIADIERMMRGPDHWIFGRYDYNKQEDCDLCLAELESGVCEVSRRRRIEFRLLKAEPCKLESL